MYKICFCLIVFFSTGLLTAQTPILWGDFTEVEKSTYLDDIALVDQQGFVLWRYQYKENYNTLKVISFEAYGIDNNRVIQVTPPQKHGDNYISFFRLFLLNGKLYGLFDEGVMGGYVSLFAWQLDRNSLSPVGEPIKLLDTGEEFKEIGLGLTSLSTLECAFNSDTTEMAISFRVDERKSLVVAVFNKDLVLQWEKTLTPGDKFNTLGYSTNRLIFQTRFAFGEYMQRFGFMNRCLSYQNGMVSMIYNFDINKAERKLQGKVASDKNPASFHALTISNMGKTVHDLWINLGAGKLVNSLQTVPQVDGSLRCIGTYTLKNKLMTEASDFTQIIPIAGLFQVKISAAGMIESEPVITELLPLILKRKAVIAQLSKINYEWGEELYGFEPRDIKIMPDGELVALFESRLIIGKMRHDGENSCNDILAVHLNKDGHATWANVIAKQQTSVKWQDMAHSSFGLLQDGKLLHFIYLDEVDRDGELYISTLNENGEVMERKKILSPQSEAVVIPRSLVQVGAKTFILPAGSNKKFRFGLAKL